MLDKDMFPIILDSVAEGVFTVDLDFIVTYFNRAAERITGFTSEEAVGQSCHNVFRGSVCQGGCVLRRTLSTGETIKGMEITILNRENKEIPISVSTALLRDRLGRVVGGVETFRDLSDLAALRAEVGRSYRLGDMVSKNHRVQEIFALAPDVAESSASVMLLGETGSGKEVLARALHGEGPRADKAFVPVNCAALPDALLEAELFGHAAGAFTDARRARKGRFAAAHGGTLFLDEVGDLSPAMQVKLLRVLEDKAVEPLGSNEPEPADARIISATHRDPRELMRLGLFREDLFYRLNTVVIEIPPLRKRREDVPLLVERFIELFNSRTGKTIATASPEAMEILLRYAWPGNVRELKHAIEHAFVLAKGQTIEASNLPREVVAGDATPDFCRPAAVDKEEPVREFARPTTSVQKNNAPPGLSALELAERPVVLAALERNHWKRDAAAKELGLSRATLWRKMKRLGIDDPRRKEK